MENKQNNSKISLWTGRILKGLMVLFFLFDAGVKIIKHPKAIEGTIQLGLPESCLQTLGIYLLISTALYIYNKTVVLGGLLITAYLGGAVAITYSVQKDGHPYFFAIVIAVIIWASEYLRNEKIRAFFPITK